MQCHTRENLLSTFWRQLCKAFFREHTSIHVQTLNKRCIAPIAGVTAFPHISEITIDVNCFEICPHYDAANKLRIRLRKVMIYIFCWPIGKFPDA